MAKKREMLTHQQISNYQTRIKNGGVKEVIAVYSELKSKGYAYATWAKGVAAEDSIAGNAAITYMNNVSMHKTGYAIYDVY